MRRNKISLRNTVRRVFIEGYCFRPAGNINLYRIELPGYNHPKGDTKDAISKVTDIASKQDLYKIRLSFEYYRIRNCRKYHNWQNERKLRYRPRRKSFYKRNLCFGKKVETTKTGFFYIKGSIKPKQEMVDYFTKISTTVGKTIANFASEKVFWIHYEVQPLHSQHNYELLKE